MTGPDQPLVGRSVVVTRPRHQAQGMAEKLRGFGADVVLIPAIRIEPRPELNRLDRALEKLESYGWVVFTSVNGVRITFNRLREGGMPPEAFEVTRVAAIGPATARALRKRGVEPAFVPDEFVAEQVAAGIPDVDGARILLPRAAGARPVLPEQLEERGADVEEIPIYHSVRGEASGAAIDQLRSGVDAITFTSPSTAENFTDIVTDVGLNPNQLPGSPLIACIGPITAEAARELGYETAVTASRYTADGLVDALVRHYAQGEPNGRHEANHGSGRARRV